MNIWLLGARPKTWGAAIAPVVVGSVIAAQQQSFKPIFALLALLVALLLQIGVNYANDYSDGVRGTDLDRVGPTRLVGQGLASALKVRRTAWLCFFAAAIAGLLLAVWSEQYWLIAIGAISIAAAWFYTGGRRPYGYLGLGEVSAFIFFGLVAVVGTSITQTKTLLPQALWAGAAIGFYAAALLMVNNIRDVTGDQKSGKKTLAVRLGATNSNRVYLGLLLLPFACLWPLSHSMGSGVWVALVALLPSMIAFGSSNSNRRLGLTSFAELVFATALAVGVLWLSF